MTLAAERAIDDDPVLGRYVMHFTSHRLRLLLQAGAIYAVSAVIITLATFNLEGTLVDVVVPLLYALVAMPLMWAVAHLWNREVIVFEHGFTYRQGSVVAAFPFLLIARVDVQIETLRLFGLLPYERVLGQLQSEQGDQIRIDWVFKDGRKLLDLLERGVLRDRLPLLQAQLAQGQEVSFGALTLTPDGLRDQDGRALPWAEFIRARVERDSVVIISGSDVWGRYPERDLHSEALLVLLLKERARP
ncbi:DUF6585 family protein [Aggregatilineales bacterium SYSU G02658]